MAQYVDGFVVPIPKRRLAAYRKIARQFGKVWMEHGALEYWECAGEDLAQKKVLPFPKAARARAGETVMFSWIVYKSRAHRDRVNARVMNDPRVAAMMDSSSQLFDMKRIVYGGFNVIVKL